MKKQSLIKNSDKENHFIKELVNAIKSMDTSSIQSIKALENIIQILAININNTWHKYSKNVNITKHFKVWWNEDCCKNLNTYQQSRHLKDWKKFKRTVKKTKHIFFNEKINEKCKLPAIEAIQHNGRPYIELNNL